MTPRRLLGFIVLVMVTLVLHAESLRPNILVVHSYHVGMPWADAVTRGLLEGLKGKAELVIIQLDVKRYPAEGRENAMTANIASKAAACNAVMVVAVDDYAYRFCLERRDVLFPGRPIVFGGINYWDHVQPPGVTGVVETIDLVSTLRLARRLHPHASRFVVVNDNTETGVANRSALDKAFAGMTDIQMSSVGAGTFQETEEYLMSLNPEQDIVLLLSWNKDSHGMARSYDEAIDRARAVCPAPIYGVWEFYFGRGIVGGSLLDGTVHGREIGGLVSLVLAGTRPNDIPVVTRCKSRLALDERELRRFKVDQSLIPREAEISFRHFSIWNQYRGYVIAVLIVLAAQGLTIAILCFQRLRRRKAESDLRKSEQNLSITLSSIGDAVLSTDNKGQIVLMNPVAEKLTGWFASEAEGRHYTEVVILLHGDRSTPLQNPMGEVLRNGDVVAGLTSHVLRNKNGDERLVTECAAPLRDAKNELLGAVMVIRDITDQRRLEEQFRQAQKMESIGLLAGGVAHDFNNILQVIKISLQMVRMPDSQPEFRDEMLRNSEEAVSRATELTRQLLAFGRRQHLEMKVIDLSLLINGLLKMIRRLIGASIEVSFSASTNVFWTRADSGQIEQVILNLCINARDAMPKGGRLVIELDRTSFSVEDVADHPWLRSGDFVQLSISDTGCGMDKATLARIFEPFYTTKPLGKGTGLGLSVVQGVVQQHKGMINVYSEPEHGTTFRIYLPEALRPSAQAELGAPTVVSVKPGLTILFAEDDAVVRSTTTTLLRRSGYKVVPVGDGQEACEFVENGQHCDLALLDIVMPKMSGLEAAQIIRTKISGIPVVLCSGYSAKIVESGQISDDFRFLGKPYSGEELLRTLASALSYK